MMSISRYFLPKAVKHKPIDSPTNDGDRSQNVVRRLKEDDVIVLIQSDDEDDNDNVTMIEKKKDNIVVVKDSIEDSIVSDDTFTVREASVLSSETISSGNRLAQWARPTVDNPTANTSSTSWRSVRQTITRPYHPSQSAAASKSIQSDQEISSNKKRKLGNDDSKSSSSSKAKSPFIPMAEMSEAEQQKEIEKWHSLVSLFSQPTAIASVDNDDATRVEQRRFHMLIATLLHARCQEPCVRKAITQLHNALGGEEAITVQTLAQCSFDTIQPHITNLQYHNTKAKYVVAASQYILEHCPDAHVPSNVASLLKVPGIGPLFADLHAFVNTPSLHRQYLQKQRTEERNNDPKTGN